MKDHTIHMQKIIVIIISLSIFELAAKDLENITIFPSKSSSIQTDTLFIFVDSLKNYIRKLNRYEAIQFDTMKRILSYDGYKGDILCYDDECTFIMSEFLSHNNAVQGFLKKRDNIYSFNIRFLDLEKEEIILNISEHFNGTFDELLKKKVSKFAEMIHLISKYINSLNSPEKNKENRVLLYDKRENRKDKKTLSRIFIGVASLGAFSSGVIMNYSARKKIKEYLSIEHEYEYTRWNLNGQNKTNSIYNRYENAYKSADRRIKARNVLYFLAGTGITCFSLTFFF